MGAKKTTARAREQIVTSNRRIVAGLMDRYEPVAAEIVQAERESAAVESMTRLVAKCLLVLCAALVGIVVVGWMIGGGAE